MRSSPRHVVQYADMPVARRRIAPRSVEKTKAKPLLRREYRSITDVARLVNVSPGTIRVWEREGLLRPRRTPGKHRLYGRADLERARRIQYLRRVMRLNAPSIRRELGPLGPSPGDGPVTATDPKLGPRLRGARVSRGLSLAEAARRTGLSVSFLSAVELGQSGISLVNLYKVAEAYGATIAGLQEEGQHPPRAVLRPGSRPKFVTDDGRVSVEDLIDLPGRLRATLLEIAPGAESGEAYSHSGEEFVYVLGGHVGFWIGKDEHYELSAGEALHLSSRRPHRWRNLGGTYASLLWVNVSPKGKRSSRPH